jgi:uncharacterized protein (TIGR02001 family)
MATMTGARKSITCALLFGGLTLGMTTPAALASDLVEYGGMKDPVEEGRKLELSANVGLTSDYVFRGFSQTAEHPAIQGGFDASYGILYGGVWGSNLDFGGDGSGNDIADIEIDLYAGVKPKLGPVEFDLGVIYYAYPDASDAGAELDFWEFKAGASVSPIDPLTLGVTAYYSPEYTGEVGKTWVVEGSAELSLPKMGPLSPSLSATLGSLYGNDLIRPALNGDDSYQYWNAGIGFGFAEKFNLDLRYWDTNVSDAGNFCDGAVFQCDARFVATLTASF